MTWNYGDLLKVLSSNQPSPTPTKTYRVTKQEELGKLLDTDNIRDEKCIQLVEVVVPRDDAPPALKRALGISDTLPEESGTKTNVGDTIQYSNSKSARLGIIGW